MLNVTMAQLSSTPDKEFNRAEVRRAATTGAEQGSDLIVLPEFSSFQDPVWDARYVEAAEPEDGPFVTEVREAARAAKAAIVAGYVETGDVAGKASNTLIAVGPDGEIITRYRKLHLYDAFGDKESDLIEPGAELGAVTIDVKGATVGLTTCYDLRFPELYRVAADAGSDLIVIPAAWTPGHRKEDHWSVLTRARAIENTVFVASVSQAPPQSTGGSLLVDPMGIVVGELGENPDIRTFQVDPERVSQVRKKNPCMSNRRYKVVPA